MPAGKQDNPAPLVFGCSPSNDLYQLLAAGGNSFPRHDAPDRAVLRAPRGAAVLILAEDYPAKTTVVEPGIFDLATRKKLRLYIEFPASVPDTQVGEPREVAKGRTGNLLERVIVTSEVFSPALERLQILDFHDARYVPIKSENPDLVLARAAGFDRAVYGLPEKGVKPILFEAPGNIMVAATKLSQFVMGRYEPVKSWGIVWNWILAWLAPSAAPHLGEFQSLVRPTFARGQRMPEGAELQAFERGVEWYSKAKLFVDVSWKKTVEEREALGRPSPPPQRGWVLGDGSEGVLEGFANTILPDGSQLLGWGRRNDCAGETSLAMACSLVVRSKPRDGEIAAHLIDFIYAHSALAQGPRNDPASPSYGLVGWGLPNSLGIYYADDNARSLLGTLGAAALLNFDRWDEAAARCLVANLRTTGKLGFRGDHLEEKQLQAQGWRPFYDAETVNYAPHFEAYPWACYLWAYDKTHDARFLDRTLNALRMTLAAYPGQWKWTNGIQQERARMLLPLAWLVRVADTPEHREWLRRMADALLANQEDCGALREELGTGPSHYPPPESNERYGTREASLIQQNGDPACDLLYTSNFAFLGLHEAAAATRDDFYRRAENKLADFVCRIQASSSVRPELDGAWFRAFNFKIWDYWASNADWGWGVWSTETGWTQAWITAVLALRRLETSLWDLTAKSQIARHLEKLMPVMLPER